MKQRRHQHTLAGGGETPLFLRETLNVALRGIGLTAAEVIQAWAASTSPESVSEFPMATVRGNLDYLIRVVGIQRECLPAMLARAPGLLTATNLNASAEPVREALCGILGSTATSGVLASRPDLLLNVNNVMAWLQVSSRWFGSCLVMSAAHSPTTIQHRESEAL